MTHPIHKFSNAQIKDSLYVELKAPIMQRSDIAVKDYLESNASYKHHRNRTMNGRTIIAAALAAMMLLSLTACGKVPPTGNSDQDPSAAGNAGGPVERVPSTATDGSSDADTAEGKDTQQTRTPPLMIRGRLNLKKVCWRTTASNRITTRNWKTAYIRSM